MTSTLPANSNNFGRDAFAGYAYNARNAYESSLVVNSTISSGVFSNSIWQTSQHDLKPIRSHATRVEQPSRNPRDLTPIPPKGGTQLANTASGKRSPISYQGNTSSSADPLSAHSRSNNDLSVLTPNSSASVGDQFPSQSNGLQDSRQARPFDPQSYQSPQHPWPNAKEFRPKLTIVPERLPSTEGYAYHGPISSASRTSALNNIWSTQDASVTTSIPSIRNDFRPVLPANDGSYNGTSNVPQVRNDSRNAERAVYPGDKSFFASQADPYQDQSQRYRATVQGNKLDIRVPRTGNGRFEHAATAFSSNHIGSQPTQPRGFHGSKGQVMPRGQSLYIDGYNVEDYYRKSTNEHGYPPASLRSDPSSQLFEQNVCIYPNETYNLEIQQYPAIPYHYPNNGLSQGRIAYFADTEAHTQYNNFDTIPEHAVVNQQIYRSPLLEEFRVNKSRKYELKDIYDHVVEFSGDQLGSRFIQQRLEVANSDEKDRIFNEVSRDSRQLMTDVFGNYVIQKMFEHGNQPQKRLLASHMKGHMFALSTQTYGCRVVQKAFEHILTDQQGSLIKELDGDVLKVVENQNGNHVIQKAIEIIPGEHIQFIVDAHLGHIHHLSKHPYGCRVIQRMLEHCQPYPKRQVLDELHVNIGELIQDAFGNYVVQHVIVNGEPQDRKAVIDKVQSKLLENAMHKFASNVVEKALDHADDLQRRAMLKKLVGQDERGQSMAAKLLTHQYGNYVIQKSTFHLTGQSLATTIDEMEQYLSQLQRVSSGKQVSALQKSIFEAKNRLNIQQRYNANNMHHAPAHPRTNFGRR